MLKNIFETDDLTNVRAISHGKAKEKLTRAIYAKKSAKTSTWFCSMLRTQKLYRFSNKIFSALSSPDSLVSLP